MLLSIDQLTKYHNDKCILDKVSLAIEEQDKIALVGMNGAGKTTLLRIIGGLESYDEGTIIRKSGLRIAYLSQEPKFQDETTIFTYMKDQLRNDHPVEEYEIKAVLSKLGISKDEKVTYLSGGQKKRVALAAALLQPCDLLILDEPTNHLDNNMVEWLEKYLMKLNRACIMVTHDRYFLERITKRIIEIDQTQIYAYEGNYASFLELKAQREETRRASEHKRKSFLRKELEWVRAGVQARGTKSKERLERFDKLNAQESIRESKDLKLDTMSSRLGKKTIEIHQISKSFDQLLFHDFEYHVQRNDRIGILGPNGCGKSTLLHILAKDMEPDQGTVIYGETVRIAYYRQTHDEMDMQMRVIDYITEAGNEIQTLEGKFSASQMLERFLFPAQVQYTTIGRLSGGERRRLYLLKVLMQMPNILFLDEPTNDLDIQTLAILEDYLDQFSGAIITISHDRYFLDRVCDKIFVFQKDKTLKQYIGGYSLYLEHDKMAVHVPSSIKEPVKDQKRQILKMTSAEKRDLETMEEKLDQMQQEIDLLDVEMMNVGQDFQKVQELSTLRDEKQQSLEKTMEYWMELTDKKQQIEDAKK